MADVKIKVNALNSLHIVGKVTDVVKNATGTKIHLKVTGEQGSFTIKAQLPQGSRVPAIGEFIHAIGNLRYSEDYKTHKIMVSAVTHIPQDINLNVIYLEGTVLSAAPEPIGNDLYEIKFASFNISKMGEIFTMPVTVQITAATYTATNRMIAQYERYIVEGYLFKDGKEVKIGAYHIKSANGIYQTIQI